MGNLSLMLGGREKAFFKKKKDPLFV